MKRFEIPKETKKPAKDLRLSIPGDLYDQIEAIATEEQVDSLDVIRHALAFALSTRTPKRTRKVKAAGAENE